MTIKFQSGGTAPFVSYTPLNLNTASNYTSSEDSSLKKSKSSSGDDDKGKLTEKDLLMAIKDMDLLPSDSKALYSRLVQVVRLLEMNGDLDPSMIATQFIRALQMMKEGAFRKEAYKEAYENAKANDGLNEYAVTSDGKIAVLDSTEGINFVTLEQLGSGLYQPLTNTDLLRLRAESFAGADKLTQVVSNGIGMEKIIGLINNAMHTIGSTENITEGYARNPYAQAVQQLLSKINEINSSNKSLEEKEREVAKLVYSMLSRYGGVSEEGLYKYTETIKNSDEQVGFALKYIYSILPKNARTILDLNARGTKGSGAELILNLLTSTTSSTNKIEWDMIENANGVKPGTKESADSQRYSVAVQFINGHGDKENMIFQDGTQDGMSLMVSTMPVTNNGNAIGITTALDLFKSDYGPILNSEQISIAGQMISPSNLNHIIQHGYAHNVDMPLDLEALAQGEIKPDLALFLKKKEADKIIEDNKYTSIEDKNRVYQSKGLPIKYDNQGKLITNSWKTFAAFDVDAYSGVFPDLDGITFSKYATELTGTEEDSAVAFLNQHNGKEGTVDYDKKDLPWEGRGHWYYNNHDAIYKSTMWIPIRDNISVTLGSATQAQINKAEVLDLLKERISTYTPEDRTR